MAANWQVNGPAIVYVGTGGAGAPERLGYTEDGMRGRRFRFTESLHSDVSGPKMPQEFQELGEAMLFSGRFVVYDPDVLDTIRRRGDKADLGNLNSIGALIGTNDYAFDIWVTSTNDRPYHFYTAILYEGEDFNLGTKRTADDIQFYAWGLIDPTADTALDTPLFEYSLPPI